MNMRVDVYDCEMKVGIVGASGYTGAELLRLCAGHPGFDVAVATADSHAGEQVGRHTPSLAAAYPELAFEPLDPQRLDGLDLVFLALPHGESQRLVPDLLRRVGAIVDLAADFRLPRPRALPDVVRERPPGARPARIARLRDPRAVPGRPGGGAAGRRRGVLPDRRRAGAGAAHPGGRGGGHGRRGRRGERRVGSRAGSGRAPPFSGGRRELRRLRAAHPPPHPRDRAGLGRLGALHPAPRADGPRASWPPATPGPAGPGSRPRTRSSVMRDAYADEPFVVVGDDRPSTKATAGSNCAHVTARVDERTGWLIVLCALDNLVKGASGQAVQCANLVLGLPEIDRAPVGRPLPVTAGGVRVGVTAPAGFVAAGGAGGHQGGRVPGPRRRRHRRRRGRCPRPACSRTNLAPAAPVHREPRAPGASGRGRGGGRAHLGQRQRRQRRGRPAAAEQLCELVGEGHRAHRPSRCSSARPASSVSRSRSTVAAPRGPARSWPPGPGPGRRAGRRPRAIMTTDTVAKEVLVAGDGFTVGGHGQGGGDAGPRHGHDAGGAHDRRPPRRPSSSPGARRRGRARRSTRSPSTGAPPPTTPSSCWPAAAPARRRPARWRRRSTEACASLAEQMAADAEGATKVVRIRVTGAASTARPTGPPARSPSRMLVKCSLNGEDPYWGRVVSELGTAGRRLRARPGRRSPTAASPCAQRGGRRPRRRRWPRTWPGGTSRSRCDLGLGDGAGVVLTTDLGYGYIDENRTTS